MIYRTYFSEQLQNLGYQISEKQLDLFQLFYEELIKWNSHTNLTRITEEKEFIDKHLLDSLSAKKALSDELSSKSLKVIDIGTGAGFPVLPLWFMFPDWKICLLDSVKKKLDFIHNFVKIASEKYDFIKLENVEIVHSRAEDLAKNNKYRENYDIIFSRAVSRLSSLVELSMPFIKVDGQFIGMKSFEIEEELNESERIIKLSGGKFSKLLKFELLNTGMNRSLVIIDKIKKTPKDFPRKAGLAQKQPII